MSATLASLLRGAADAHNGTAEHIAGPDCLRISLRIWIELFGHENLADDGIREAWDVAFFPA